MSPEEVFKNLQYKWAGFTLEGFIKHIETLRNRPIVVVGIDNLDVPLCAKVREYDFIFYSNMQTKAKQIHDILHECAHILLGHIDNVDDQDDLIANLDLRFRVYRQRNLDQAKLKDEQDAEQLAYIIQSEISDNNRLISLLGLGLYDDDYKVPLFARKYQKGNK